MRQVISGSRNCTRTSRPASRSRSSKYRPTKVSISVTECGNDLSLRLARTANVENRSAEISSHAARQISSRGCAPPRSTGRATA
jgi:hypothetical protein